MECKLRKTSIESVPSSPAFPKTLIWNLPAVLSKITKSLHLDLPKSSSTLEFELKTITRNLF